MYHILNSGDKYQIRHAVYQQFNDIIYAMGLEKNGSQLIGDELKVEEGVLPDNNDTFHIEGARLNLFTGDNKFTSNRYKFMYLESAQEVNINLKLNLHLLTGC